MTSILQENTFQLELGSFRDRNGRILYKDGQVYRLLSKRAFENWQHLSNTRFFKKICESGAIVQTEQIPIGSIISNDMTLQWEAALWHERIPAISYPYEWSFGMLKDAALLQLELLLMALEEGMILKDSSAFNFQWKGSKPVFIDTVSFEILMPGEAWVGYKQFCQLFLFPLMLQAHKDIPFQELLRGNIEGIDPVHFSRMLTFNDWFKQGVLTHVILQSKLQQQYSGTQKELKSQLTAAGFSKELIVNNVRGLKKVIQPIEWQCVKSQWSDYAKQNSYTDVDKETKINFVQEVIQKKHRKLAWDLGCNTGTFSRIAAGNTDTVLAMDADHLAIEMLYQTLKAEGNTTILPLVMNVAQPSPALGWQGKERKTLTERGKPDITLCLALIHHIVISANIPMNDFIQWLGTLETDLIIEFVTKEDPMVKTLLRNKVDQYDDYNEECFEGYLDKTFNIIKRKPLESGTRILYYAEIKASP